VLGRTPLALISVNPDAKRHPLITMGRHGRAVEEFRSLRTTLQFVEVDNPPRVIVVTSPLAAEGKTTTACNLAIALAQSSLKVCLVEGDLRRPMASTVMGIDGSIGLSNVVAGQLDLADALLPWHRGLLTVLPAGTAPPDPTGLLGSNNMALEFIPIEPRISFEIDNIRFTPIPVNHEVPTIGLVVQAADATVVFTSDTSVTDDIWAAANQLPTLRAVFVDCSFPDELEDLAIRSGHLTPRLVVAETAKLSRPTQIICVHIKPDTRDKVLAQLAAHHAHHIAPVKIGKTYQFDGTPLVVAAAS